MHIVERHDVMLTSNWLKTWLLCGVLPKVQDFRITGRVLLSLIREKLSESGLNQLKAGHRTIVLRHQFFLNGGDLVSRDRSRQRELLRYVLSSSNSHNQLVIKIC